MDIELVRRGMAPTRERAQDLIREGKVLVSGSVAGKPARMVDGAEPVELAGDPMPYVSRGGLKLAGALDAFGIDPAGLRCLDVGASTGGFTDCLLQRGAVHVVAVDVGRGQLDWSLRTDARVTSMERTDVRTVHPGAVGPVGLTVVDVSFISLRTILPALAALAAGGDIVALVKPQFEVGRARVGSGGIVRDPQVREDAVAGVIAAAEGGGLGLAGRVESTITGTQGNVEYFVHLRGAGRG